MDFLSIAAFLLIFIVVYALLVRSGVLGDNKGVALFISFLMASFFVIQTSLVEFVSVVSGWVSVLVVVIFFLLLVAAFIPGDKPLFFLNGKKWFGWIAVGIVIGIFVLVSSYVFSWAVNWDLASKWVSSAWFGWVLLIIVALIVSRVMTKSGSGSGK